MEKAKLSAIDACTRLGAYRMPFAWTAIWLQNIIKSKVRYSQRMLSFETTDIILIHKSFYVQDIGKAT